jgi:membrane protein YqaA with SNARE-associated domain
VRTHLTFLLASSWARSLIAFFVRAGVVGPFLLEVLDSSFFYVPLANELLLFALIHNDSGSPWMWVAYAVAGALGSVVGVLLLDLLMRRVGAEGIERLVTPKRFERIKSKMESHAGWVVFLASALPPPFPFRVTIVTASALQSSRQTILTAVFFGRVLRFAAEALLILYFGRRFLKFMNSPAFEYVVYGFALVAVVGSAFTIYKLFAGGREKPGDKRR